MGGQERRSPCSAFSDLILIHQFATQFPGTEVLHAGKDEYVKVLHEGSKHMPTPKQSEFFGKLLEEKNFGEMDTGELQEKFDALSDSSASEWIERALQLPKRDGSSGASEAPPF